MKKLVLASCSPQRKKLLEDLGVKFTIKSSSIKEDQEIRTTCSALVQHNALLKAEDVAGQLKSGVVVGADTVVYGGNKKIIGKPRNLKEAKEILQVLFSKPHWVYTGVAVIDIQGKKKVVDYEKTKVYMLPLTDEEIDRYHRKVSPLDKAGGFDIEGGGSVFIHRIEGCYTNVIGLPVAKLAVMLRKVGVFIL
ncbi:MAG: septum formation protein Maf [Candidatus Omnitrophica bacterium]|nr:septum formation protein Maf [Candidatus Omnitrophota bacterium]